MHLQKTIRPEDCSPRRHRVRFAVMTVQLWWAVMLLPMLGALLYVSFMKQDFSDLEQWPSFALFTTGMMFLLALLFAGGQMRRTQLDDAFSGSPVTILLTDQSLRVERYGKVYTAYLRNVFWTRVTRFQPTMKDDLFLEIGQPGVQFILPHRALRPERKNWIYMPLSPDETRKVLDFLRQSECREAKPRPVWFAIAAVLFSFIGMAAAHAIAAVESRFAPWECGLAVVVFVGMLAFNFYYILLRPWPARRGRSKK